MLCIMFNSYLSIKKNLCVCGCAVFLCPVEQHTAQRKDDDPEEEDCEWTFSLQPHTEAVDAVVAPPPSQAVTADVGQVPVAGTVSADGSPQDDSSKLPSSVPQVTVFP